MPNTVSIEKVLPVVKDWFDSFIGEEDCENIAQEFAIGLSDDEDCFDILANVCRNYGLNSAEFEGICIELEDAVD